jgi:hypothetical protein
MWDTWAAWEPTAEAHLVSRTTELPADERDDAISAAAHRLLIVRYDNAVGASASLNQFDSLSPRLCIDPAGAGYKSVNPPLQTALAYISMKDPNRWQPLDLEVRFTQSGQAESDTLQSLIDPPPWGSVTPFALDPSAAPMPIDPGPPPLLTSNPDVKAEAASINSVFTNSVFIDAAVEVIRYSASLDPANPATIDIWPGSWGDNPLGTNDGAGLAANPSTGW